MDRAIEYGVQWSSPDEIAGSVTHIGLGEFNRERAEEMLELVRKLPGGQDGKVVLRTITWGDWE